MKKGIINFSLSHLTYLLQFPKDWEILNISKKGNAVLMEIKGDSFPEVIEMQECNVVVHETPAKNYEYELKRR